MWSLRFGRDPVILDSRVGEHNIEYRTSPHRRAGMRPTLPCTLSVFSDISFMQSLCYYQVLSVINVSTIEVKICVVFQWCLSMKKYQHFLKRAPGFRSMKYDSLFSIFANWTNQQRYETPRYDIGWWFGGSVGIEQFDEEYQTKQYSQFPPVQDFGKPWIDVAYVPCVTNLRALYAWLVGNRGRAVIHSVRTMKNCRPQCKIGHCHDQITLNV